MLFFVLFRMFFLGPLCYQEVFHPLCCPCGVHQVSCVINNFKPAQLAGPTAPPPPQQHPRRPDPPLGTPLVSLPRVVESPLEKLSGLQVRGRGGSEGEEEEEEEEKEEEEEQVMLRQGARVSNDPMGLLSQIQHCNTQ